MLALAEVVIIDPALSDPMDDPDCVAAEMVCDEMGNLVEVRYEA